jgi:tRNA 5-methylaminomethyl-2-thiouridine biosynthesis bifunctional protein
LFDRTASKGAFLDFVSVEKFPLSADEIRQGLLPWAERLSPYLGKMLDQYPIRVPGFHRMVFDGRVALTLVFDDANDALPEIDANVDAWFLDGFTPSKNPDMWSENVFCEMARLSHSDTSFSTFTAAGFVKRGLQNAGFHVEKVKGFGPKRDMLKGHFKDGKLRQDCPAKKTVLVHGAGLAGSAAAYVLKQYGIDCVVFDPNGISSGASGNSMGLINPRFTAFRNAESDFYTAGFALTQRTFRQFDAVDYKQCGSLHLANDEDKQKRYPRTLENWKWNSDHMQYLSLDDASRTAGVDLSYDALYLPDSAQVNPKALCHQYLRSIKVVDVEQNNFDIHILAIGAASVENGVLANFPIHTVRGQITEIRATPESQSIKTNICYGGYISAPRDGIHVVGSTFQKWLFETNIRLEDDVENIKKLSVQIPSCSGFDVVDHRSSLRTASNDRFPIVGTLTDSGFLVSAAHGSHGIVSSLVAAHLLADIIRGGVRSLGKTTIKALSPERFALRK